MQPRELNVELQKMKGHIKRSSLSQELKEKFLRDDRLKNVHTMTKEEGCDAAHNQFLALTAEFKALVQQHDIDVAKEKLRPHNEAVEGSAADAGHNEEEGLAAGAEEAERTQKAVETTCRPLQEDITRLTAEGSQLKEALAKAQMTIDDFEIVGMVLGKEQQRLNPQQLADQLRRLLEKTDTVCGNEKKRVTQSKQKPKGALMVTAKKPKTQVATITPNQLKQIFQLQGRLAQLCPDTLANLELNEDELGQYTQVQAKEHLEVLMKKLLIATTAHAQATQEGVEAKGGLEAITRALAAVPDDQLMPDNVVRKYTDLKSQVKILTQQQDEVGRKMVGMIRSTTLYQRVSLALGATVLLVLIVLVVVWPQGSGASITTPPGGDALRPYDFSDLVPKESSNPSMMESEWDHEEEEVEE